MTNKYLFITYGSKRIKGVQTKAIHTANFLPKDEVLVINHGDDSWLKHAGLKVYNLNYNAFELPNLYDSIVLKHIKEAKVITFCDFPTNMLMEYLIFYYAYKNLKTPICIFDNIYNSKQLDDKIYSIFYKLSDLMLLSGISYFGSYIQSFKKAIIIPPFFETPTKNEKFYREKLIKQLKIKNENAKIILYIAYNEKVLNITKDILNNLSNQNFYHIVLTTSPKIKLDAKNVEVVKKEIGRETMRDYILASDLVIAKFGYQQLLEGLSLKKPIIVVGDSGLSKDWLDEEIRSSFFFYKDFSSQLINQIRELLTNDKLYANTLSKIQKLHDGKFDGAKIAASAIKQLAKRQISKRVLPPKIIALTFNTKENLKRLYEVLEKELFVLPIIISERFAERDFGYPKGTKPLVTSLQKLTFTKKAEVINPSSFLLFNFSEQAYHGFAPLFPFTKHLFEVFETMLKISDKVYLVGEEAKSFFKHIIKRLNKNQDIIYF